MLLSIAVTFLSLTHLHALHASRTCASSTPPSAAPREPSLDAMRALLPDEETFESFFDSHFARLHLHIAHSNRGERADWLRLYRTFAIHHDVTSLLSTNVSHTGKGALQMIHDVDLVRVKHVDNSQYSLRQFVQTLFPDRNTYANTVDISRVRTLVSEGFEFRMHHMHTHTCPFATFVRSLTSFWALPVSASLHYTPQSTGMQSRNPAPELLADDTFVVCLDGSMSVTMLPEFYAHADPHHRANQELLNSLLEKKWGHKRLRMDEGDVLYVPRGYGFDARTDDSHALVLHIKIPTHGMTARHGLLAAIEAGRKGRGTAPVDELLPGEKNLTYGHFLTRAIEIAAEFTHDMRRYIPVEGQVVEYLDEVGVTATGVVSDVMERFITAGSALWEPVTQVLAEGEEETLHEWASGLTEGGESWKRGREGFKRCVEWIGEEGSVEEGVMELGFAAVKRLQGEWWELLGGEKCK